MKATTKKKLVKKLDEVQNLLQKCGGPGGTPGPCPTGGGKPAGGHSGGPIAGVDKDRSAAHIASVTANNASRAAGGRQGPAYSHSQAALAHSNNGNYREAANAHLRAAAEHKKRNEHEAANAHIRAAALHDRNA